MTQIIQLCQLFVDPLPLKEQHVQRARHPLAGTFAVLHTAEEVLYLSQTEAQRPEAPDKLQTGDIGEAIDAHTR